MVIRSFADRNTERVWNREPIRSLDSRILRSAPRKLVVLDAATALDELRIPPGNRLEVLKGDRAGQHSIRVNDQWRVCFTWTGSGPQNVEIADYHQEVTDMDKLAPVHPGEVLMEDFIGPLGITQNRLAVAIGVPPRRINEIVHGQRRISADTALRLGRYFGTSAQFWVNLQSHYDLEVERDVLGAALDAIRPLQTA